MENLIMFDNIVKRYDFLNHLFSFMQDYYWRRIMIKTLLPLNGQIVLDLASGTGDSANPLVKKGFMVIGLDISKYMLLHARQEIPDENFIPIVGSAYQIPFKDETFYGITCAFGIRNMHQTKDALKEIFRVLKNRGKAVFLEFSMPNGIIKKPYCFYLKKIIPPISSLFSERKEYQYLGDSIEKFYTPLDFARLLSETGFSKYKQTSLSLGCVYIHSVMKD